MATAIITLYLVIASRLRTLLGSSCNFPSRCVVRTLLLLFLLLENTPGSFTLPIFVSLPLQVNLFHMLACRRRSRVVANEAMSLITRNTFPLSEPFLIPINKISYVVIRLLTTRFMDLTITA